MNRRLRRQMLFGAYFVYLSLFSSFLCWRKFPVFFFFWRDFFGTTRDEEKVEGKKEVMSCIGLRYNLQVRLGYEKEQNVNESNNQPKSPILSPVFFFIACSQLPSPLGLQGNL